MNNINFVSVDNIDDFAVISADFFSDFLQKNDNPLVILPTGFTPLPFYKEIVKRYKAGEKYLNKFKYLALDEYVGLCDGDYRSFSSWLGREILDPLSIDIKDRIIFDSDAADIDKECKRIDDIVSSSVINLAIIGIGENGHVGFNEPKSSFSSRTRKVFLHEKTIKANAEYWGGIDKVPKEAVTLGLANLKNAKNTLLLVYGKKKAKILKESFCAPVSEDVPSSYLQNQPNLTVIGDEDALAEIMI